MYVPLIAIAPPVKCLFTLMQYHLLLFYHKQKYDVWVCVCVGFVFVSVCVCVCVQVRNKLALTTHATFNIFFYYGQMKQKRHSDTK